MRRYGAGRRRPGAKNGRGQGRAKRYARCHFEDIWALKRVMARRVEQLVGNSDEVVSIHLDMKQLKSIGKMRQNCIRDNFVKIGWSNLLSHAHGMVKTISKTWTPVRF